MHLFKEVPIFLVLQYETHAVTTIVILRFLFVYWISWRNARI